MQQTRRGLEDHNDPNIDNGTTRRSEIIQDNLLPTKFHKFFLFFAVYTLPSAFILYPILL